MWTKSDLRGCRAALTLALLLAGAPRTGAAQELRIAVGGEVTRVPAATSRSYPAFPLALVSGFGGKLTNANGYVVVHLFGDTLRFREGLAHFQVNGTAVPLYHWTFAKAAGLFLPQAFFTDWLTSRYPDRLRFSEGTLIVAPDPSTARADTAITLVSRKEEVVPGRADSVVQPPRRDADSIRVSSRRSAKPRKKARAPRDPDDLLPGTLQGFIDSRVSGVYDSNIDHDLVAQSSYGTVGRLAVGLQSSRSDPLVMAQYNLGFYRFANTERWNRTTHDVSAEVAPLFGFFRPGLAGSVRVGSVTEDRELVNQLALRPRLEFRLSQALRVSGYGEQRVRRITGAAERSDTSRLAGLTLARRWRGGGLWETQGRYERNRSERASSRYLGWAGRTMVRVPLTRADRIALELTHQQRRYPERMVEIGVEEVARRDRRWTPTLSYTHDFAGGYWALELEYELESNRSNDPEEEYLAHRTGFTIRRRW